MGLLISSLVGGGSAIASGVLGSNAASSAASQQSQAAVEAAQIQAQAANQATQLQQTEFNTNQANIQPWLQAGQAGLNNLQSFLSSSASSPFAAAPPTNPTLPAFDPSSVTMDPGYQFRMDQANKALQNSFAAEGNLGTGAAAKELVQFNQDAASQEYQNAYGRAYGNYQQQNQNTEQTYGNAVNAYQTAFNVYNQNQGNQYNRLAALAGVGQSAAGQIAQTGATSTNAISNLLTGSAQAQAQGVTGAAAAGAAGTVGSSNAITNALQNVNGAIGGGISTAQLLQLIQQLQQPSAPGFSTNGVNTGVATPVG